MRLKSLLSSFIWGETADRVAESLSKGDRVMVVGNLRIRRVQDEAQKNVQYHEIVVEEIGPTLRWASATLTKAPKKDAQRSDTAPAYDNTDPF